MTGLECLKEEMLHRGCTKSQVESKVIAVVLDIVANENTTVYSDTWEAEKKLHELNRTIASLTEEINYATGRKIEAERKLKEKNAALTERQKDAQKYLEEFEQRLMKCETKEQRDALRTAQFYVNNTEIRTPQNNTAYIIGLALILSGKNIDGENLKRVSLTPDIFYEVKRRTVL